VEKRKDRLTKTADRCVVVVAAAARRKCYVLYLLVVARRASGRVGGVRRVATF
jgi:hypothetical protein